ncbi:extracellular catalytic domain type 1 short-chain-length polyhydroxyalkanoate depolymerase [Roseomonas fluvialis]|uniref:Esterase n=1 Tax=Roseomonas fluvialis TaxID=1750527 RepID=A0ABN6NW44_9PROT|nr:PHB depolymerase family esterase [Roseomonas fluvialis]BDG70522.1 esterase [Roseomonas fluvialis]
MNAIRPEAMLEATRLTREGKLTEATAMLQRLLSGVAAPDAARAPSPDVNPADANHASRIIDIDPATGELLGATPPPPNAGSNDGHGDAATDDSPDRTPPRRRSMLHGFMDRLTQGDLTRDARVGSWGNPLREPAPLPDGAEFVHRSFRAPEGRLDYKLYIPARRADRPLPMLVMLHGCTQTPDDFAAGTRMNALAEEHGLLIVYPEQTKAANAQKCWNWFKPADQQRDQGEPALIAGLTQQVLRDLAADRGRVYVAGLSAGGAAAAIMAQAYPDIYAAVGVHSGLPCGAARDIPTAFAAMRQGAGVGLANGTSSRGGASLGRVPTIVFHADQDSTVHPRNGDLVVAQAGAIGGVTFETFTGQVPGGHAYSRTSHMTASGTTVLEHWLVHGAGHAWSGGSSRGSYTDPKGPDASREMLRFFLQHSRPH